MGEDTFFRKEEDRNRHYESVKNYFFRYSCQTYGFIKKIMEGINSTYLHNRYKLIFEYIVKKDLSVSSVLDAGCGHGNFTVILANNFPQLNNIIGLDFLDKCITKSQEKTTHFKNVNIVNGNLLRMSFEEKNFDVTLCIDVFHHIYYHDMDKVVKELTRVTKKYLVIDIKNKENIFNFWYNYFLIPTFYKDLPVSEISISYINYLLTNNGFRLIKTLSKLPIHCCCRCLILVYERNNII